MFSGNPAKPSDKQISFAQRLADEKGVPLPDGALKDRRQTSKFIDEMIGGSGLSGSIQTDRGDDEPSLKQLTLVTSLCRELSEGIPAHALVDKKSLSNYIDELMDKKNAAPISQSMPPARDQEMPSSNFLN
eukprot:SAG31_NODE_5743_length_2349_cov_1.514667_3_plen_130_part_01